MTRQSMSKFDPHAHPMHVEAYPVEPSAPGGPPGVPTTIADGVDEVVCRDFLSQSAWTPGLIDLFLSNSRKVGIRHFLLDDSGSMQIGDGHLPLSTSRVPVSRWTELADSMRFHTNLLEKANIPVQIRFLNATSPNHPICMGGNADPDGVAKATVDGIFEESPGGGTPLCAHIREIVRDIQRMENTLRRERKKAVIVIATDGLSSDGDIQAALKPLERLPVWLVIKLCTDDDDIVNYWNEVDNHLEVEMDVLDDFASEAQEIKDAQNGWLNYGLPLHRLRESGLLSKEFDLLDEGKLTHDQMLTIVASVLGNEKASYPHPAQDWGAFFNYVEGLNMAVEPVEDPLRRLSKHKWLHLTALRMAYAPGLQRCSVS